MESNNIVQTQTRKGGFDPNYLEAFQDKVFIEGPQTKRRLINFFVLLCLATVIATYGVLSNSTATVIGAMIVAPLMGPIMATTAAVVMGSTQRALRSLALVIAGVITVILLSILLSLIVPDVTISFTNNGEIASRISPKLLALLTALGAGAAGAFIISRSEIADSMGGVAIAISLVPPLCVVGISISQGEWTAAGGSLLLFLTNFVAILLAGGITFIILGLGTLAVSDMHRKMRQRAFVLIVIATLLITASLSRLSYQSIRNLVDTNRVATQVEQWLEGSQYQVFEVNVSGQNVQVTVEGNGELRPLQELTSKVAIALGHPVKVTLRIVPSDLQILSSEDIQNSNP
jgi:uncharacterized hydrophobic protein (TIGR00271 family)